MLYDRRARTNRTLLLLLLINLLALLVFYVFEYISEGEVPASISGYFNKLVGSILPVLIPTMSLFTAAEHGFGRAVVSMIPMVLVRSVYLIPY